MFDEIFKYKIYQPQALKKYGFCLDESQAWVWKTLLPEKQFLLTVSISSQNGVKTCLTDVETNEPYTLHLTVGTHGTFVQNLNQNIAAILSDIAKKCFVSNVFTSVEAHKIIAYMAEKYHLEPEYLWPKFPANAVFRRADNKKWICAILTAASEKLGFGGKEVVEMIDLRGRADDIEHLIDKQKYFPAYHMNKKHWFTICLNDSVPINEIYQRIDESFDLAKK